ncbi:MAG: hypothetical protein LJE70_11985 [Chromatiaceae bacterium]|nr:hypothetical protein [Chromatiaceae bacterium]
MTVVFRDHSVDVAHRAPDASWDGSFSYFYLLSWVYFGSLRSALIKRVLRHADAIASKGALQRGLCF